VPTMAEAGFPGVGSELWIGLFVPARTPATIIDKLHSTVMQATQRPTVRDAFTKSGVPMAVRQIAAGVSVLRKRRDQALGAHHQGQQR